MHWGVYESGKTTAARQAAWRLQEEAGKQVMLLQSYYIQWNRQGENWLRRAIRLPEDMHDKPMTDFFTQDTTIIIDHFDMFMCDKDNRGDETLELVIKFIEESERTKKFNMLLVVTSWDTAGSARRSWWTLGASLFPVTPLPDGPEMILRRCHGMPRCLTK